MSNKFIHHQNRAIIEIKGLDRKKFLQGLITNDIEKASESNLIYSVMLNPKGRFLYDFFISEIGESLILDCFEPRRDEILQKLKFYKLRSKVEIIKNDELFVMQILGTENVSFRKFQDPRHQNLGFRSYLQKAQKNSFEFSSQGEYDLLRISNKIAESELDLTYEKSFILEFAFDDLNAIDYKKGCYVGQELTARTHYRGEIRKKLLHVTIEGLQKITKGQEFSCEGKSIGVLLSSVFYDGKLHALALIKLALINPQDSEVKIENLEFENNKITLIS